jgi:prolyl-tRNA editing enzyme YbaK/EbsC (Cys-tRNA(Pro) deacylase)
MTSLPKSAQKVQDALDAFALSLTVILMPDSTRTAQEAADALHCTIAQIAKSLIFRGAETGRPILIIASGANRVNEKAVGRLIGEKLARADADYVQERTGFAIGGIPPLGHSTPIDTYIDEDLLQFDEIWAAAGTPHAVFALTPEILKTITGGEVISVK